jgi:hypothetical protein
METSKWFGRTAAVLLTKGKNAKARCESEDSLLQRREMRGGSAEAAQLKSGRLALQSSYQAMGLRLLFCGYLRGLGFEGGDFGAEFCGWLGLLQGIVFFG